MTRTVRMSFKGLADRLHRRKIRHQQFLKVTTSEDGLVVDAAVYQVVDDAQRQLLVEHDRRFD